MDTTERAAIIVVDCDGRRASWDGTTFWGDSDITLTARHAAQLGAHVDVLGMVPVKAGDSNPLAAAAALCAYSPGRTVLVDNPDEVAQFLDEALSERGSLLDD